MVPGSFRRAKPDAGVGLTIFTWTCSRLTGEVKFKWTVSAFTRHHSQ